MSRLIIVGAGAAGLFAAGTALAEGHSVTLVEHAPKPAQKLAITGKGRCNLTNDCEPEEFLKNIRHNPRFLYSAITALPPASVMDLFQNQLGVPLKIERGRRVFPQSDRAEDIIAALLRYAEDAEMVHGEGQRLLLDDENHVAGLQLASPRYMGEAGPKIAKAGTTLAGNGNATNEAGSAADAAGKGIAGAGRILTGDAVLVATGGLSYQFTGSTGLGYTLAKQAGHSIVPPVPSLVSLVERGGTAKKMMGLSLRNVELSLWEGKKVVFREQGEMLFTHFGLSGPLVLSASAYLGNLQKKSYRVTIDLKPALTPEQLDSRIQRDFADALNKSAANSLDKLLPNKMRPVMLALGGVNPEQRVNQITREERHRLVGLMKKFPVEIAGRGDLAHAVITAGGVSVKQVDPKTMESKLTKGLYFAGEVLDVDGYTGGYNLQIAWATAYAAAMALGT